MENDEKLSRLATLGPAMRYQAERVINEEDLDSFAEAHAMTPEQAQEILHKLFEIRADTEMQNEQD